MVCITDQRHDLKTVTECSTHLREEKDGNSWMVLQERRNIAYVYEGIEKYDIYEGIVK